MRFFLSGTVRKRKKKRRSDGSATPRYTASLVKPRVWNQTRGSPMDLRILFQARSPPLRCGFLRTFVVSIAATVEPVFDFVIFLLSFRVVMAIWEKLKKKIAVNGNLQRTQPTENLFTRKIPAKYFIFSPSFCLFIILNFICPCPVIITLNLLVGARTTIATVQVTDLR